MSVCICVIWTSVCVYASMYAQGYLPMGAHVEGHTECLPPLLANLLCIITLLNLFCGDFLHVNDMFLLLSPTFSGLHPTIIHLFPTSPSSFLRQACSLSQQYAFLGGLAGQSTHQLLWSAHLCPQTLGYRCAHYGQLSCGHWGLQNMSSKHFTNGAIPQPRQVLCAVGLRFRLQRLSHLLLILWSIYFYKQKTEVFVQLYYVNAFLALPRNASRK